VNDPAELQRRLADATDRLLATAEGLTGRPGARAVAGTLEPRISGPSWLLLAWLTGRSDGEGLATDPAGPLPEMPAW